MTSASPPFRCRTCRKGVGFTAPSLRTFANIRAPVPAKLAKLTYPPGRSSPVAATHHRLRHDRAYCVEFGHIVAPAADRAVVERLPHLRIAWCRRDGLTFV